MSSFRVRDPPPKSAAVVDRRSPSASTLRRLPPIASPAPLSRRSNGAACRNRGGDFPRPHPHDSTDLHRRLIRPTSTATAQTVESSAFPTTVSGSSSKSRVLQTDCLAELRILSGTPGLTRKMHGKDTRNISSMSSCQRSGLGLSTMASRSGLVLRGLQSPSHRNHRSRPTREHHNLHRSNTAQM